MGPNDDNKMENMIKSKNGGRNSLSHQGPVLNVSHKKLSQPFFGTSKQILGKKRFQKKTVIFLRNSKSVSFNVEIPPDKNKCILINVSSVTDGVTMKT